MALGFVEKVMDSARMRMLLMQDSSIRNSPIEMSRISHFSSSPIIELKFHNPPKHGQLLKESMDKKRVDSRKSEIIESDD